MRSKFLGTFAVLFAALPSFGQVLWSQVGGTTDIRSTDPGSVGIGLNPWRARLHVHTTADDAIWGDTTLANAIGVAGASNAVTGTGVGVYGWSQSTSGIGTEGIATHTTGYNIGVYGQTNSINGTAVHAQFNPSTGTGEALVAVSNSADAFAIYSFGGKNYFSSVVGIGTSAPSAQLHTTGTVRLEGVPSSTSGTDILAVDGSGNVSKQLLPLANGIKEFRTVGTTAWTVPTGITRVKVRMWGGGGGGGGGIANLDSGGSGAYIETILDVSAISSLSITVGAAGTSSINHPTPPRTSGTASTVKVGATTLLSAGGGAASLSGPGTGGAATNNTPNTNGLFLQGYAGNSGGVEATPPYPGPANLDASSATRWSVGTGGRAAAEPVNGALILEW